MQIGAHVYAAGSGERNTSVLVSVGASADYSDEKKVRPDLELKRPFDKYLDLIQGIGRSSDALEVSKWQQTLSGC